MSRLACSRKNTRIPVEFTIGRAAIRAAAVACVFACIAEAATLGNQPDISDWSGYYMPARGKDLEGLKPPMGGTAFRQMILDHLQPWVRTKM